MSLQGGFLFGTRKRRHYYFRAVCHPSFLISSIPRLVFLVRWRKEFPEPLSGFLAPLCSRSVFEVLETRETRPPWCWFVAPGCEDGENDCFCYCCGSDRPWGAVLVLTPRAHWAVQGCPSTRGAAQTCSGLFWNKQNKDSQNNARGFEILFLFFEQKWGVSRSIHIFQVIIFLSQWQGHIRTDRNGPRNEDLPIILSRAQIFLSHCPHSCCC